MDDPFKFKDKERHVTNLELRQLGTVFLSTEMKEKIECIKAGEKGTYVFYRNIPPEELVPAAEHLNTYQLAPISNAAAIVQYIVEETGITVSTIQRTLANSFDTNMRRTKNNFDLVVFI